MWSSCFLLISGAAKNLQVWERITDLLIVTPELSYLKPAGSLDL